MRNLQKKTLCFEFLSYGGEKWDDDEFQLKCHKQQRYVLCLKYYDYP